MASSKNQQKTEKELHEAAAHAKVHVAALAVGVSLIDNSTDTSDQSQEAMKERARLRAPHYRDMTAEEQWMEDKRLGILDYDGR